MILATKRHDKNQEFFEKVTKFCTRLKARKPPKREALSFSLKINAILFFYSPVID